LGPGVTAAESQRSSEARVGRKRDVRATSEWDVWREEAPWMTVYFSIGVWTSLAMVLL